MDERPPPPPPIAWLPSYIAIVTTYYRPNYYYRHHKIYTLNYHYQSGWNANMDEKESEAAEDAARVRGE